jgi:hypothetical protein
VVVVFPPHSNLRFILILTGGGKVADPIGQAVGIGWPKEFYRR